MTGCLQNFISAADHLDPIDKCVLFGLIIIDDTADITVEFFTHFQFVNHHISGFSATNDHRIPHTDSMNVFIVKKTHDPVRKTHCQCHKKQEHKINEKIRSWQSPVSTKYSQKMDYRRDSASQRNIDHFTQTCISPQTVIQTEKSKYNQRQKCIDDHHFLKCRNIAMRIFNGYPAFNKFIPF